MQMCEKSNTQKNSHRHSFPFFVYVKAVFVLGFKANGNFRQLEAHKCEHVFFYSFAGFFHFLSLSLVPYACAFVHLSCVPSEKQIITNPIIRLTFVAPHQPMPETLHTFIYQIMHLMRV